MDATTWPLFGLTLRTERLELRIPTDDDLRDLNVAMRQGIVGDEPHPFSGGWLDEPEPARSWQALQFHWRARAELGPEAFNLSFVTIVDDEIVGTQGVVASDFQLLRGVGTGSWLATPWQGRGYGTEMRAAVLEFAFTCLDATHATSSARETTEKSIGVSTRLGYRENGRMPVRFADEVAEEIRFRIDRDEWLGRGDRPSVAISGWEACRPLFEPS